MLTEGATVVLTVVVAVVFVVGMLVFFTSALAAGVGAMVGWMIDTARVVMGSAVMIEPDAFFSYGFT